MPLKPARNVIPHVELVMAHPANTVPLVNYQDTILESEVLECV
jgi:hypothetical protein